MADAKEFLRLSQEDLHIRLRALRAEYADAVRRLGQEARSFRITSLRDALENATAISAEIRDDIIGEYPFISIRHRQKLSHLLADLESYSFEIRELAYQEIKKVIGTSFTRYTAKTAFQTIEARISRKYDLDLDIIRQQYKAQIVQPWIESLNREGERTLLGTIGLSSNAARESLNSALEREKARYQREIENKQQPLDEETVELLVAVYVNLLAAEEALQELNGKIDPQ